MSELTLSHRQKAEHCSCEFVFTYKNPTPADSLGWAFNIDIESVVCEPCPIHELKEND